MRKLLLAILTCSFLYASATEPGYLGIVINTNTDNQVAGVRIVDAIKNGAAEEFGLQADDIITSINKTPVKTKEEMLAVMATLILGEKIAVSYVRNGNAATKEVILGQSAQKTTIKVSKSDQPDGEHWTFGDDQTELIIEADKKTYRFIRHTEPGVEEIFFSDGELFPDNQTITSNALQKLAYVRKIKHDREKCSCSCPITQYTFYNIPAKPVSVKTDNTLTLAKFNVYPNPNSGVFNLEFATQEKGKAQVTIMDISGKLVRTEEISIGENGTFSKQINLENLGKGAYFVRIKVGDKWQTKQIVVQ
ncbi:MAG: T9SS type A sorting domain-containing protein [Chitinophagales bacterium]|nr:T9SS type A sorting domain-containing protein [Chitinophagales bacterium]